MRVFLSADLHLGISSWGKINPKTGLNTMVEKFLAELEATADRLIAAKADIWIIAGDIFHTPNPTNVVRQGFTRVLQRVISQGIDVLIVTGNSHDRPVSFGTQHSLAELEAMEIPGLTIVSESRIMDYDGFRILCLPWQRDPNDIMRDAQDLLEQLPPGKAILVGHFTVSGAMTGSEKAFELYGDGTVPIEAIMDPRIEFAFLGHIHKHQSLFNKVFYIGSMERVDFGERFEEKGSMVFDWTPEQGVTNLKVIQGTPQKYVQLECRDGKWDADWKGSFTNDAVVKIKIICSDEERRSFDFETLYRGLSHAKYVLPPVFETPEEVKREVDQRMSTDLTFEQALKLWLEKQTDIQEKTKVKILQAGKELLAGAL
jgi:exonuclease SbcD